MYITALSLHHICLVCRRNNLNRTLHQVSNQFILNIYLEYSIYVKTGSRCCNGNILGNENNNIRTTSQVFENHIFNMLEILKENALMNSNDLDFFHTFRDLNNLDDDLC
jgi:hypothetical protein